jgi:hypothetical protein
MNVVTSNGSGGYHYAANRSFSARSTRRRFAGCSYSVDRTVTSTYTPAEETVTTITIPAYASSTRTSTSQGVITVTRNPDGSVTRTSTYYPPAAYSYYGTDDQTLASQVRSSMRQDPLVSAHARHIGIGSDAGVVEITGKADPISAVQQASLDALQTPEVRQVNNDMIIDPTSPG